MKRLIYIDTSEFVASNFDFSGSRLQTVISRANSRQIVLGLPSITRQEIISQIDKTLHEADQAIARARSGARILRNLDDEFSLSLFRIFDRATYRDVLTERLDAFLLNARAEHLDFQDVNPGMIFDLYFSKQAPFGDGKKKTEFPDAFILSVLSGWAESEQQDVLIASSDSDIEAGAKNFSRLQHVGTLEQLLDRIAREFDQLVPTAELAINTLAETIDMQLRQHFHDLGFVLTDQQGEVTDILAMGTSYESGLLHVEELDESRAEATFDLVGRIFFEADLTYDDLVTAMYDSEEKQLVVFNTINESVERDEIFQATIRIIFSQEDGRVLDFDVTWNSPKDVSVHSSLNDGWPYK